MAFQLLGEGREKKVYGVKEQAWSVNHSSFDKDQLVDGKDWIKASFYLGQILYALKPNNFPKPIALEFTVEDAVGKKQENVLRTMERIRGKSPSGSTIFGKNDTAFDKDDAQRTRKDVLVLSNELVGVGVIQSKAIMDTFQTNFIRRSTDDLLVYVDSLNPVYLSGLDQYSMIIDPVKVRTALRALVSSQDQKTQVDAKTALSALLEYENVVNDLIPKLNSEHPGRDLIEENAAWKVVPVVINRE